MSTLTGVGEPSSSNRKREVLDRAVIRFCGDSGDGMQITGNQFTNTVALYGNDLATFPDYPAEIRAPAGTLPGVSGFQIQFSSGDVFTDNDLRKAQVTSNPLEDHSLDGYRLFSVGLERLTRTALQDLGLDAK